MLQHPAIEIVGISKTFGYRKSFAFEGGPVRKTQTQIQALKNIFLQIPKGECVGIIGGNGAGKSTLLKILAGTLKPDKGKIVLRGSTSSILDIGAGLHPDLSGWENIFMGGTLLGKSKDEVKKVASQIIAFSGLEDFMDLPVKHYSTGMFMRLAFSIATHFDADIILLDEVYSVGDIHFREKCAQVIFRLKQEGKTIVLVSHELQAVQGLCSICVLMDNGSITDVGETRELIEKYVEKSIVNLQASRNGNNETNAETVPPEGNEIVIHKDLSSFDQSAEEAGHKNFNRENVKEAPEEIPTEIPAISMVQNDAIEEPALKNDLIRYIDSKVYSQGGKDISMLSDISIEITFEQLKPEPARISLHLNLGRDMPVMGLSPYRMPLPENHISPGIYTLTTLIPAGWLNNGLYTVDFLAVDEQENLVAFISAICYFKVRLLLNESDQSNYSGKFPGPMMPILKWALKKL